MIGNDETLRLVLEANDKATAVLERVRGQIELTGASANRGGKATSGLNAEIDRTSDSKLLKGARAMSSIARASEQAQFGTQGATRAMGQLAETLALASGSAAFVGWAVAINAAVVAGGALVSVMQQAGEAAKPSEYFLKHVQNLTLARAQMEATGVRAQRDSALNNVGDMDSFMSRMLHRTKREGDDSPFVQAAKDFADSFGITSAAGRNALTVIQNTDLLTDKVMELTKAERLRLIGLGDQTTELVKQHGFERVLGEVRLRAAQYQVSSFEIQKAEAVAAKKNADAQVETMFRFRDADGQLHKLTADELSMRGTLLQRNRENYTLTLATADAKYKTQQGDTQYAQEQTIWYATRRLGQSDYQTSLDTALHSLTDQLYALARSGKLSGDITAETNRLTDAYLLQKQLLEQMHEIQTRRLRAQNDVDATGGGLFGPGDAMEQHEARLKMIEEERLAAIKAGQDKVEANRKAQNDIRKEAGGMVSQSRRDYKTIEDVLVASKSRQIHAIGEAARTIRKLEIGAEGAHSAVLALKEGAAALASFAHGDFLGGGMHLASAAQFAAAAALAGQESLGGGGASSGGGGGGGGTSGAGTFEPRDNGQGSSQVINLYTTNPYGREQIQQVKWELDRAGVLKRPAIQIAPTTGIRVA